MLLLTTDTIPSNLEIIEMYSMVQFNKTIEISSKGLLRGIRERKRNEHQEALDSLVSLAPPNANAIIGIRVTSSAQSFNNGTFLYFTYIGTPIVYKGKND